MHEPSQGDSLQRLSAYVAMAAGSLMVLVGLAFLFVSKATPDNKLQLGPVELSTTAAVLVLVLGALLIALPWLPQFLHRPAPLAQPTPMGMVKAKPHAKGAPSGEAVVLKDAATLFVLPHDKTRWEVIGPDDLRAQDDVSMWDVPLMKAGKPLMPTADGRGPKPISQYSLRYKKAVAVGLDADTVVDGLSYSGDLPKDPALYERFLRAGIAMQLMPLRQDPAQLEGVWQELEIEGELPTLEDGSPDVDAALRAVEAKIIEKVGEDPAQFTAQMDQAFAAFKNEVPVQKRLFHSLSFRIYRVSDVLASDPMFRLIYGDKMTTWNFVNCLPFIDRSVNLGAMENMQWADGGDSLSFSLATRLENVEVNGNKGALGIRRMFFVARDEDRFHLLRADVLEGRDIDAAPAHEGITEVLGSWRVGAPAEAKRVAS